MEIDNVATPPFVVQHLRHALRDNGTFTPGAQLVLAPALKTGGLLADLPDTEARTLLALLTCLSANGRVEANAEQVARVLGVSHNKALARLRRLCQTRWQGEPVVWEREGETGLARFAPARHVVGAAEDRADPDSTASTTDNQNGLAGSVPLPPVLAGREAIVAHSRAQYGRPRVEVEAEIAAQLGYLQEPKGTPAALPQWEDNPLAHRLIAVGVPPDQVTALLAAHTEQEITDQLEWLPLRAAKNPARFLVAAIQNQYEPPARIRLERAIALAEATPSPPPDLPVGETADLPLPGDGINNPTSKPTDGQNREYRG